MMKQLAIVTTIFLGIALMASMPLIHGSNHELAADPELWTESDFEARQVTPRRLPSHPRLPKGFQVLGNERGTARVLMANRVAAHSAIGLLRGMLNDLALK